MKVLGIEHVAVAHEAPQELRKLFEDLLGLSFEGVERVEREGVDTHFLKLGASHLEILEPLGPETTVGRFLAKRGPGLHHIALAVEGLDDFVTALKAANIQLLSEEPVLGAKGKRIIFIHPKSAGGVLIELSEEC